MLNLVFPRVSKCPIFSVQPSSGNPVKVSKPMKEFLLLLLSAKYFIE